MHIQWDDLFSGVAKFWGLPPEYLSDPHGWPRVALTTWLLDPYSELGNQCKQAFEDAMNHDPYWIARQPYTTRNPMGAVIAELPVYLPTAPDNLPDEDLREVTQFWLADQKAQALRLCRKQCNRVLLRHGFSLTRNAYSFMNKVEYVPGAIVDQWVSHHLRKIRFIYYTKVENIERDLKNWASMVERLPKSKDWLPANLTFGPPRGVQRKQTLYQKQANRHGVKNAAPQKSQPRGKSGMKNSSLDDDLKSALAEVQTAGKIEYGKSRNFSGRRDQLLCATPQKGGLSRSEIELIVINATNRLRHNEQKDLKSAASMVIISCLFVRLEAIPALTQNGAFVSCSTTKPQSEGKAMADLLEPSGDTLYRPAPPIVLEALRQLRDSRASKDEINAYLRTVTPRATIARVYKALRCLCPVVWNFAPVLSDAGLDSHRKQFSTQRSYLRIDARIWQTAREWIQMFEPSYVMPDTIPAPCGSRVVPKLEHVQTLVRIFRDNYKDFKNGCVPDLKDLNGLTAILLLLWQLMAGARNVPTELPGYLLDGGGCIGVAKDNIISLYNWPEVLNEPLEQLFDVQYEVLRRHPDWKVPMTKWTPRLDFISLDRTKNQLDYSGTGPQEIRNALSAFPPTRHLSKVYKFALRHFSMNELYASNQFAAADIESFHHRHAVATSSLGRDSMEDPRMPVMRERMQRYLWRLIS